jgi:hypothetical protein
MPNYNPTYVQSVASQGQTPQKRGAGTAFVARVTHVVSGPYLEGTSVVDVYYNDPTDLGNITFQLLGSTQDKTSQSSGNNIAKPIHSSIKHVPLEGEFVYIMVGPSVDLNDSRGQVDYYYMLPFNLWGASHHNALPDSGDYGQFVNSTVRGYGQSEGVNQPNNTSTTSSIAYPLGPNFPEKSNIKSLRIFAGDVSLEGRWGNSIRFGSTTAIGKQQNYWSDVGTPGDPITIIRNGQGKQLDETAWIPTVENINRDASSIYLTAGQKVVVDDIQNNFSLASWQINLENTVTNSIPLQQQLTSYESLSPLEQDKRVG